MNRVPEPELMDSPEQAAAYAGADFEEPHGRFIEEFKLAFPDEPVTGPMLDLGCGPADITIRFAHAFPDAQLDGLDAGPNMLGHGLTAIEQAGLMMRIRLSHGHIPEDTPPRDRYGVIISNSLLHHLPEPMDLWQTINRHAAARARVFVMDLRRPPSREAAEALVGEHAAGEPDILRRDFFNSLLAAYTPAEVRRQLEAADLGGLEVAEPTDLHVIVHGRMD